MLRKSVKILTEHCDASRCLRLSSLLKFFQEISIEDTENLGYPRQTTLDRGLLWVIGKQRIKIERMPRYDEHVELLTYPGPKTPFLFPRHCFLSSTSGQTLVSSSAVWSLIDEKKRAMIDPKRFGIVIEGSNKGNEIGFVFPQIGFELDKKAIFAAKWRDCDLNGHMNNTAYIDEVIDLVPVDYLKEHAVSSLDVAYKREIPLGASVEVNYGQRGDEFVFSSPSFFIRLIFGQ
jgi:medium-chain acyl-[acyl-carrier-protein] hydrolase